MVTNTLKLDERGSGSEVDCHSQFDADATDTTARAFAEKLTVTGHARSKKGYGADAGVVTCAVTIVQRLTQ